MRFILNYNILVKLLNEKKYVKYLGILKFHNLKSKIAHQYFFIFTITLLGFHVSLVLSVCAKKKELL